ncbi:recombinase family protein [Heyndrickxia sporothermodurans]
MKSGIGYIRVSTQEQGRSGLGLSAQREAIQRFATANGYEIAPSDWFEEVASGKSATRPILNEAIRRARRTKGFVICAKLDRLSRNTHFVTGLLEHKGVKFRVADVGDEADNTFLRILAVFAEREREQIGERTRDALRAAVRERGVVLGNPTNLREAALRGAESNARQADEFASEILPRIMRIRAAGAKTFREIATALNALGVRTARHGDWHHESVRRLIERAERQAASCTNPPAPPPRRAPRAIRPTKVAADAATPGPNATFRRVNRHFLE